MDYNSYATATGFLKRYDMYNQKASCSNTLSNLPLQAVHQDDPSHQQGPHKQRFSQYEYSPFFLKKGISNARPAAVRTRLPSCSHEARSLTWYVRHSSAQSRFEGTHSANKCVSLMWYLSYKSGLCRMCKLRLKHKRHDTLDTVEPKIQGLQSADATGEPLQEVAVPVRN